MDGSRRDYKHYDECEFWCCHKEQFELCTEPSCSDCSEKKKNAIKRQTILAQSNQGVNV